MAVTVIYKWVCDLCGAVNNAQIPPDSGFIPVDWTRITRDDKVRHICYACRKAIVTTDTEGE